MKKGQDGGFRRMMWQGFGGGHQTRKPPSCPMASEGAQYMMMISRLLLALVVATIVLTPSAALADSGNAPPGRPVPAPAIPRSPVPSLIPDSGIMGRYCNFNTGEFRARCIITYLQYLIWFIFTLVGGFFFLMIIIAGYQIAIGSVTGDKESGKERLKWAIIGFILAAFSFFLIDFIVGALAGGPIPRR